MRRLKYLNQKSQLDHSILLSLKIPKANTTAMANTLAHTKVLLFKSISENYSALTPKTEVGMWEEGVVDEEEVDVICLQPPLVLRACLSLEKKLFTKPISCPQHTT